MDPSKPPSGPTAAQLFFALEYFGPLFVLVAIALLIWLCVLLFRARPQSDYLAFIAAALYPLLLGILGGSWNLRRLIHDLGDNGNAMTEIQDRVRDAVQMGSDLYCGSLLTCLFFPIGVGLLLFRRPK